MPRRSRTSSPCWSALFAQQRAQGGDGVVLVVERIAEQEQSAFFGGEKEDEAHHHCEGRCRTAPSRSRSLRSCAAGLGVDAVESLHEHFNRLADLVAELIGDFLLVLTAFDE